ncbi:hypothetical protein QR680_004161 [Steinernema hermaphroditum]|uniref:Serpin domain-containing protein n=1 Tax=Steinernema hermaphroditum TaxID=289476 RepID=A0AA39LSR9_9BILA|nr:hypothetical protein QR680_004161 [Steinernema hermaphroditum]
MRILFLVSCIVGLCLSSSDPQRPPIPIGPDEAQKPAINDALFRLALKTLNEKPNESGVVSPFSIGMALATVNAGAGGKTSKEITDVAFPGIAPKHIEIFFDYELLCLGPSDYGRKPVDIASAVYLEKSLDLLQGYEKKVAKLFRTKVEKAEFAKNPEAQRVKINKFASDATKGHINELFKSSDISAQTKVAVVNAIHISSRFVDRFAKKDTKKKAFHNDDKTVKQIDMLNGVDRDAKFAETDDYVFASLHLGGFNGPEYFVLVPKKGSLAALKQQFISSTKSYSKMHDNFTFSKELHITMPKFKTKTDRNLRETLKKMGIKDMFDEKKADFTQISKARLSFSELIHQAELEIDENGVTAAADSAHSSIEFIPPFPGYKPTPHYITVDRPFIFGITNVNVPVFIGQYYG